MSSYNQCGVPMKQLSSIRRHEQIQNAAENKVRKLVQKCPHGNCSYKTAYPEHMRRHMKSHSAGKRHRCSKCKFACENSRRLKQHMISHARELKWEELPIKCTVLTCAFRTTDEVSMIEHLQKHSSDYEERYACPKCNFRCKRSRILKRHMIAHMDKTEADSEKLSLASNLSKTFPKFPTPLKIQDESSVSTKTEAILSELKIETQRPVFQASKESPTSYLELKRHTSTKRFNWSPHHWASVRSEDSAYNCKLCDFRSPRDAAIAWHNENVHGVPFVVLNGLRNPQL